MSEWAYYPIEPCSKPRMTRYTDRQSPPVARYRAFRDEARLRGLQIPERVHMGFHVPMPKSWSKRDKELMDGRPHQARPDVDNLGKAVLDAMLDEDSSIWDLRLTKQWSYTGAIYVRELDDEIDL